MKVSKSSKLDHQIIFTTSRINRELDSEELTVGPQYTHQQRTLRNIN